jgi:hypothetical protein
MEHVRWYLYTAITTHDSTNWKRFVECLLKYRADVSQQKLPVQHTQRKATRFWEPLAAPVESLM